MTPFIRNFGSWKAALKMANMCTERSPKDYKRISDDELIDDVKRIAIKLDKNSISSTEYNNNGKYKVQTIITRFGSWKNVLKVAKLEDTSFRIITDEDLYNEIERLWLLKGSQPTTTDLKNGWSIYSLNTFSRRFGGWRGALQAFMQYIEGINDDESIDKEPYTDVKDIGEESIVCKEIGHPRHKTSRNVNLRLRYEVFCRDNFKCCICGNSPAKDPAIKLHVDHIIPWSKGGETVMENLQTLCSKCNLGKSDLDM